MNCFPIHTTHALPPNILLDTFSGAPGTGFLKEIWYPDVVEVAEEVRLVMAPADLIGPSPINEEKVEMFLEDTLNEPALGMFLGT